MGRDVGLHDGGIAAIRDAPVLGGASGDSSFMAGTSSRDESQTERASGPTAAHPVNLSVLQLKREIVLNSALTARHILSNDGARRRANAMSKRAVSAG